MLQDGQLDLVLLRTQGWGSPDKPITSPCTAKAGTQTYIPGTNNGSTGRTTAGSTTHPA